MHIHLLRPNDIHPPHWYGVARYATELVSAITDLYPSVSFSSFHCSLRRRVPLKRKTDLAKSGVELRAIPLPDFSRSVFYTQILEKWCMPSWVQQAGCDISWGTNCSALPKSTRPFRTVVTIHDLFLLTHPELSESYFSTSVGPRLQQTAEQVDLILTDSQFTKKQIVEILGIDPEKVLVTHLGVSSELHHSIRKHGDIASSHEKRKDEPLPLPFASVSHLLEKKPLLSVGTIEPRKNYELGLFVYRDLLRLLPDLPPWVIIGNNGWKFDRFYRTREQLKLEDHVHVISGMTDNVLHRFYHSSHCLFCPSLIEGFGLPVLEAMTTGLPVVCSTGGSLPEIGGEAVISIPPHDKDGFVESLHRIFTKPELKQKLAQQGLQRAQLFSWENAATQVIQAFQNLLNNEHLS